MENATKRSETNACASTPPRSSAPRPSAPRQAIGIDVSKDTLDITVLGPGGPSGARSWRTSVPNSEAGFDQLRTWMDRELPPADEQHACLEASGGYHEAVARWLFAQGLTVSVVNPRRLTGYATSTLRRSKTDASDAALLARFCQREGDELNAWKPPEPEQQALQEMARGLQRLKKERDRLENQLGTTGHDAVAEALEAVLERVREQIEALQQKIDEHVQACERLARKRELLESIPGIGSVTATLVMAEMGEISRFESARQVAAYAGLTPRHYESGTSVERPPHLSKMGNARLRKAMYFPALTALRCNAAVKVFGERLAERGKARMVIVGAAMRKLLHICYGVLKNGQPFDASLHPGT